MRQAFEWCALEAVLGPALRGGKRIGRVSSYSEGTPAAVFLLGGLRRTSLLAMRYLARALSIARRSAGASGVTSLGKKATTLPFLPTRYLAKFHAGRWPMLPRNL